MKELMESIIKSFEKNEILKIKEHSLKFAQDITRTILKDNNDKLKQLIDQSCEIRDEIEFEEEIERTREFYFGYWYAYENISRRIFNYNTLNENIDLVLATNDRLRKMVKFLGEKKAARQKDISEYLGIDTNVLANFMNTETFRKLDIISKSRIGRNMIYSLNAKGRRYYRENVSEDRKNYSKSDVLKILKYVYQNSNKGINELLKSNPILDDEMINEIHNINLTNIISDNTKKNETVYLVEYIKRRKELNKEERISKFNDNEKATKYKNFNKRLVANYR